MCCVTSQALAVTAVKVFTLVVIPNRACNESDDVVAIKWREALWGQWTQSWVWSRGIRRPRRSQSLRWPDTWRKSAATCVSVGSDFFCVVGHTQFLIVLYISVVTDSESATESTDSSRVRPLLKPRIFCGRKWRFWVICSQVNIYLSGGGIQETLRNCVCLPVRPCGRLNGRAATAPPPPLSGRSHLFRHASLRSFK